MCFGHSRSDYNYCASAGEQVCIPPINDQWSDNDHYNIMTEAGKRTCVIINYACKEKIVMIVFVNTKGKSCGYMALS